MRIVLSAVLAAVAVVPLILISSPLRAQALLGHVVDDGTGAPVSWAALALVDASGDTVSTTLADSSGWFLFRPKGPGPYRVLASRVGYLGVAAGPVRMSSPFDAVTLEVRLAVSAVALEPLRVIAEPQDRKLNGVGFYRRQRYEQGVFLTPLQIEARNAVFTEDLLRPIPGVDVYQTVGHKIIRLVRGRAMSLVQPLDPTGCPPEVYVQGMRQADTGVLPVLNPQAIRGIEVYRGPSEVPAEYGGLGAARCGVVMFWLY
ncbi:MAG TPA: TonB-dependent receptor [Longimicrobiales bacterium]|nr:TonB-dependent receptor [Longimicrobiales bacterium]